LRFEAQCFFWPDRWLGDRREGTTGSAGKSLPTLIQIASSIDSRDGCSNAFGGTMAL
jgi:hypothetical protein